MRCLLAFLFIFIFSINFSYGSEVFFQETDLKQVVNYSGLILVVKVIKPFINSVKIKISGFNKRELFKPVPDFESYSLNFEVVKILKDNEKTDLTGKKIIVYTAFIENQFELHKKYYTEKISKSPIYRSYKSSIKNEEQLEKETEIIIFVKKSGKTEGKHFEYQFTFKNAYEKTLFLPEVEKLINEKDGQS